MQSAFPKDTKTAPVQGTTPDSCTLSSQHGLHHDDSPAYSDLRSAGLESAAKRISCVGSSGAWRTEDDSSQEDTSLQVAASVLKDEDEVYDYKLPIVIVSPDTSLVGNKRLTKPILTGSPLAKLPNGAYLTE